ncbi:MAG TPA: 4Fe-4S binding protein [Thermoanaerobacterales bacterium]|nr:4Fe-4S binding protein [Thermoanaerobacterales bacterium]
MAYFITDDCIACGVCQAVCPVECISEEGDIYKIDADECTDCGSCAEICPVGAPIAE